MRGAKGGQRRDLERREPHIGVGSPDQTDVRLGNHRNGIPVAVLECDEMDGSLQFQKGVYQEAYCTSLQTTCLLRELVCQTMDK